MRPGADSTRLCKDVTESKEREGEKKRLRPEQEAQDEKKRWGCNAWRRGKNVGAALLPGISVAVRARLILSVLTDEYRLLLLGLDKLPPPSMGGGGGGGAKGAAAVQGGEGRPPPSPEAAAAAVAVQDGCGRFLAAAAPTTGMTPDAAATVAVTAGGGGGGGTSKRDPTPWALEAAAAAAEAARVEGLLDPALENTGMVPTKVPAV